MDFGRYEDIHQNKIKSSYLTHSILWYSGILLTAACSSTLALPCAGQRVGRVRVRAVSEH